MNANTPRPTVRMQPPDPATLVACAWRYKWVALLLGCIFAGLGVVAAQIGIPAKFKATALVRLAGPSGLVETRFESSAAQREFRSTQQELIRMPHVLQRALESPKIKELGILGSDPDGVEYLGDLLQLELPRSSEILRISVQHDKADVAFLLTNAVSEAYLQEVRRAREEDVQKRLTVLEQLHREAEERLAKSWDERKALARQLGSGDPTAVSLQAQAEFENYRDYHRRLRDLQSKKREAERLVKSIREAPETLTKEMPEDASVHSVKYKMVEVRLKREAAEAKWGPNHPEVVAAKHEEDVIREVYQKALAEQTAKPKSRQEELLAEPLATIAQLSIEEQALEAMIKDIDERKQLLSGDNAAKLEVLRNDIDRLEKESDRLWQTRENLKVESHADQRVQLVSLASLPTQRDTSKRKKMSLVLAVAGLGFAVFLVAVGEFLTGRLHSAREATQRTGLEVLTSLPRLPAKIAKPLGQNAAVRDSVTTRLDMLVARLTHQRQGDPPRTVLVTSARLPRERECVAAHVAAALARTGHRTVLVNFDLRDPQPQLEFPSTAAGIPAEPRRALPASAAAPANRSTPSAEVTEAAWHEESQDNDGLSASQAAGDRNSVMIESQSGSFSTARQQFPAEMPLVGTGVANLDFLQPVRGAAEPLPVLAHPQLPELMDALKMRYAYVVVDVSGVLEYPDAAHLAPLADVALLSLQRNKSVAGSVAEARDALAQYGRPVFGTMID